MQQWSLTIRMSFTFLTKDKMNKKKKNKILPKRKQWKLYNEITQRPKTKPLMKEKGKKKKVNVNISRILGLPLFSLLNIFWKTRENKKGERTERVKDTQQKTQQKWVKDS